MKVKFIVIMMIVSMSVFSTPSLMAQDATPTTTNSNVDDDEDDDDKNNWGLAGLLGLLGLLGLKRQKVVHEERTRTMTGTNRP